MTDLDSYSPLESLLLFQAFAAFGTQYDAFDKISESLRQSSLLKDAVLNERGDRFGPESLKKLYLKLLKEDAKQELQEALEGSAIKVNGDVSTGGRKRKAGSPQLLTVEDAAQHAHLVPQTIARLYARFQDQIVREIKDHESRFDSLIRQPPSRSRQPPVDATGDTFDPGSLAHEDRFKPSSVLPNAPANVTPPNPNSVLLHGQHAGENQQNTQEQNLASEGHDTKSAIDLSRSGQPHKEQAYQQGVHTADRTATSPVVVPAHQQQGLPLHQIIQQQQHQQQTSTKPPMSVLQQSYPQQTINNLSTLSTNLAQIADEQQVPRRPVPLSQPPVPEDALANSAGADPRRADRESDRNVPIRQPQPESRVASVEKSDQISGQGPQPKQALRQGLQMLQQHIPIPSSPYTPDPAVSMTESQHKQQLGSNVPKGQSQTTKFGGYQLPPFQLSPHRQTPQMPIKTSSAQYSNILKRLSEVKPVFARSTTDLTPRTPVPSRLNNLRSDIMISPGSSTVWKIKIPTSTPFSDRPRDDDISPISEDETENGSFQTRFKSNNEGSETADFTPKLKAKRLLPRSSRDSKGLDSNRAPRTGHNEARTSSQSTDITGKDLSKDLITKDQHHYSQAHVNTPGADDVASDQQSNRKSTKRKRDDINERADGESMSLQSPVESDVIIAYRNFSKMTAPIMYNITSHKYASVFANPVKDRNAEGYTGIIKAPQNLKSIKAAITAGSRIVAAFAASEATQASPGGLTTATTIALPWSEDIVPPKGIVNAAQLECELMRMFANAVMFNPGDQDMVKDARDMYHAVEEIVGSWRATERPATEKKDDTPVEDVTISATSTAKKRRL